MGNYSCQQDLLRAAKENRLEDRAKIDEQQTKAQANHAALSDAHPVIEDKAEPAKQASHSGKDTIVKSPGEKKFETITYKGIAWLGAAGLGITIAQILEHGKGRALFNKSVDYLAPRYQKLMKTNEQTAREAMSSAMTHASFISGVSLVVPPVKKLEDDKAEIVQHMDQKINERRSALGDNPTEEELDIQQEAYERIKSEPKQSWSSLLVGRTLGVSSVFFPAIFLVKGADKKVLENVAEKVTSNKQAQSLGVLVALEVGYTFISEEVLHFTSKLYAKSKHTPEEQALKDKLENPKAELAKIDLMQANKAYTGLSLKA